MESGSLEYNTGSIYYESVGNGKPVILIHGFSLDHRMWRPQVDYLKNNYRVISYDLRGFGNSSLPTNKYSHHDDLFALIKHLNINQVHIIGLSLGGEVAIDFTIKHPEFVKRLTIADSSLGGFKSTVDWNVHPEDGLVRAKSNWLNHAVFKKTNKDKFAAQKLRDMVGDYSGWHWYNNDPREKLNPVAMNSLYKISCQTEIVLGEYDLDYYHEVANMLSQRITKSKKHIIPNSGHVSNLENTILFNGILNV